MTAKFLPESIARDIATVATGPDATPLVRAKLARVLTEAGYAPAEIAALFGCHEVRVGILLDLLNLSEVGQALLGEGALPEVLGYYISRLGMVNQDLMIARWRRGGFSSVAHAERYARMLIEDERGVTATAI